jgi:hypothetical protein
LEGLCRHQQQRPADRRQVTRVCRRRLAAARNSLRMAAEPMRNHLCRRGSSCWAGGVTQGGWRRAGPPSSSRCLPLPCRARTGKADRNGPHSSPRSRVVVFRDVDHDMMTSETGCMKERARRTSWAVQPSYLDTVMQWVREQGGRP